MYASTVSKPYKRCEVALHMFVQPTSVVKPQGQDCAMPAILDTAEGHTAELPMRSNCMYLYMYMIMQSCFNSRCPRLCHLAQQCTTLTSTASVLHGLQLSSHHSTFQENWCSLIVKTSTYALSGAGAAAAFFLGFTTLGIERFAVRT